MIVDSDVIFVKEPWSEIRRVCGNKKYCMNRIEGECGELSKNPFMKVRAQISRCYGNEMLKKLEIEERKMVHFPIAGKSVDLIELVWKMNQERKISREVEFERDSGKYYCGEGSLNVALSKLEVKEEEFCFGVFKFGDVSGGVCRKKELKPLTTNVSIQIEDLMSGKVMRELSEQQKEEIENGKKVCGTEEAKEKMKEKRKQEEKEAFEKDKLSYGQSFALFHKETKMKMHSHPQKYVNGSKEQQVTCYPHEDDNDYFVMSNAHGEPFKEGKVKSGDIVRITHVVSGRFVHTSKGVESPTSKKQEVCCFPAPGNSGDNWKVVSVSGTEYLKQAGEVRVEHVETGCFLYSHKVNFGVDPNKPEYGEQQEVVCEPNKSDPNNVWKLIYRSW